jgi:hypothetical protein
MPEPSTTSSPAQVSGTNALTSDRQQQCSACGARLRGRYCAACGALGEPAVCRVCATSLAAGDRFCPGCGASVRAEPERVGATRGGRATWLLAGGAAAMVLVLTLVQYARRDREAESPREVLSPGAVGSAPTAPDISAMTAQQQADRLFDRVMRLRDEGKIDSVRFFVPMALAVYQRLGPLNLDQRYDLGTVANAAGMYDVGRAQADSILREHPTHLLGLVLAIHSARGVGNEARAAEYGRRLLAAEPRELQSGRSEYARHASDIRDALAAARRG